MEPAAVPAGVATPRRSRPLAGLALGLAAGLLFAWLASPRLEGQGPQYDELHQAVGAFTWLGAPPPPVFCLDYRGFCVLNMSYSAAIKTNLYGIGLRLLGRDFDLGEWRWLGILVISASLLLFALLARGTLGPIALAVCLGLMVTDGALLLLGRYDWGPIALALANRLLLLGLWLRGEFSAAPRPANTFALAALAGFGVFEKLSSAVVVVALCALLLASRRRRSWRHALALAAGLGVGLAPLALVNLGWLRSTGELISLRGLESGPRTPALELVRETLALGEGGAVGELILGVAAVPARAFLESALFALTALTVGVAALRWRQETLWRGAAAALLGYLAAVLGLCLLPRTTWAHHWIAATPFQYLAAALAIQSAGAAPVLHRDKRVASILLVGAIAAWLGTRVYGVVAIERALGRGEASLAWHPSLSQLGEFAARRADHALFVAAGWGVGNQIRSFGNGRPGLVEEPFWDYRGAGELHALLEASGKSTVYLVRLRSDEGVAPAVAIEADLLADLDWLEVPAEAETESWRAVAIRKFQARR